MKNKINISDWENIKTKCIFKMRRQQPNKMNSDWASTEWKWITKTNWRIRNNKNNRWYHIFTISHFLIRIHCLEHTTVCLLIFFWTAFKYLYLGFVSKCTTNIINIGNSKAVEMIVDFHIDGIAEAFTFFVSLLITVTVQFPVFNFVGFFLMLHSI